MVTSLLYYRTNTSRQDQTPDPRNLPNAQKLEFTQPNDIMDGITEDYENIITKQVSVNQTGVRRMFLRDDGMKMRNFQIFGILDKLPVEDAVNRIIDFRTRSQRGTSHPHGTVGFLSGNSTNFSIDPNATGVGAANAASLGLMIERTHLSYEGRIFKKLMFRATLIFGGEHETVTVT